MRPNFSQNIFRAIFKRECRYFLKKVSVIASRGVCFFTPILGKKEIALGPNTEVREYKNAKYKVGNREIANIYPVTQYRSSQSESRIITTQSSKAFKSRETSNRSVDKKNLPKKFKPLDPF